MPFEDDFYSALVDCDDLTALVGEYDNVRIFPEHAGQSPQLPYVVYSTVAEQEHWDHGGDTGLRARQIQVDVYATTPEGAEQVDIIIRNWLVGQRKVLGAQSVSLVKPAGLFVGNVPAIDGDAVGLFVRSRDYEIWY